MPRLSIGFNKLFFVFFLSLLVSIVTPIAADTDTGINWLKGQQLTDDSDIATQFQATAELIRTFNAFEDAVPAVTSQFLKDSVDDNTETIAHKLLSGLFDAQEIQALATELLSRQNTDGGFGEFEGYHSTVLDTAFALQALGMLPSVVAPNTQFAVSYLLSKQETNGGFSHSSVNDVSIYETAMVSVALQKYKFKYSLTSNLNLTNQYLITHQLADSVWETAQVLLALIPTQSDPSIYQAALDSVKNSQLANGSWDQDVYSTALALRAIDMDDNFIKPSDPTLGTFTGQVISAINNQPLAGATVILTDVADVSTTTSSDGSFTLSNLVSGEHTIMVSLSGYSSATKTTNALAGLLTSLGVVKLTALPNKGTVFGVVRDAETNQVIPAATVTVSGSSDISVTTNADGFFSVELAPGEVSLLVSADGHDSAFVTTEIVAGNHLDFSPQLSPAGTSVPTSVTANIIVVDAATNAPIEGAAVSVVNTSITGLTGVNGKLTLEHIVAGTLDFSISATDYLSATANVQVTPGTFVNLGVISLSKVNNNPDPDVKSMLSGLIRDAKTNQIIKSASVILTGSTTVTVMTDDTGTYQSELEPGSVSVTIHKDGYTDISTAIEVTTDQKFNFSPYLNLIDSNPPQTSVSSVLMVVDDATNLPLEGVLVQLQGTNISGSTNAMGILTLDNITAGALSFELSLSDYQAVTATVLATAGSHIDMGIIRLSKSVNVTKRTLRGRVTDAVTGEAIEGAFISIDGTNIAVTSGSDGFYTIEDTGLANFVITITADSYTDREGSVTMDDPGQLMLNIELRNQLTSTISIEQVRTDAPQYLAYKVAIFSTIIKNSGAGNDKLLVFAELINEQNEAISRITMHPSGTKGTSGSGNVVPAYDIDAGKSLNLEGQWFTGVNPAGKYKIRIDVYSQVSGQLLSQKTKNIMLIPTQKMSISIKPTPVYSAFQADRLVELPAVIRNLSNVSIESNYSYSFIDPDGVVVKTGDLVISLNPIEQTKKVVLDSFQFVFNKTGIYSLALKHENGLVARKVFTEVITVAPTIRVEVDETIAPKTVLPDGDKRIRINIQLRGVQQQ